jgi:glucose-1-phosphate cytidylyltransferase
MATLTAVQPPGRFGTFTMGEDGFQIKNFLEKANGDTSWISGGFFVCEPAVIDLIKDDSTSWEREPMESLALTGNLFAYRHTGFWQCMDTLRDKHYLEDIWKSGRIPWKHWC